MFKKMMILMIFLNDDFNDQAYTNDVTLSDFQVLGNVTITRPILTLHVLASEAAGLAARDNRSLIDHCLSLFIKILYISISV